MTAGTILISSASIAARQSLPWRLLAANSLPFASRGACATARPVVSERTRPAGCRPAVSHADSRSATTLTPVRPSQRLGRANQTSGSETGMKLIKCPSQVRVVTNRSACLHCATCKQRSAAGSSTLAEQRRPSSKSRLELIDVSKSVARKCGRRSRCGCSSFVRSLQPCDLQLTCCCATKTTVISVVRPNLGPETVRRP